MAANDPDTGAESALAFARRLREGVEAGLELEIAAASALATLPRSGRDLTARIARRLTGDYHEDEWGFDEEFAESLYPLFDFLYEHWWRVKTMGASHVPSHGRGMLVANHAGSLFPFDASMITAALMKEHPLPRWPRLMVGDWASELPFASAFMRKLGGVSASPHNATRILTDDELMLVFPEGTRGPAKPYRERYRLRRFGRGGFVEIALRTRSPIVPVAVVGSEEIYPKLGEGGLLAKLTGAPFVPLTPTFPWLGPLGLIPLPARWRIEFCEPIDISGYPAEAADDPRVVFELTEMVRRGIERALRENLLERGSAFA